MSKITAEGIRAFLVGQYADQIRGKGFDPGALPDNFDFLLRGVIDSLGVLQMIGDLEKKFQIELDMSRLDPEQLTVLGPLSRYVAEAAGNNGKDGARPA
ncbi:MAG TPA: acyl carrier protein [Verrucomicrobiae bacterium]|nr:acyl carrier protein [Verrucomicrobiae bacterium]